MNSNDNQTIDMSIYHVTEAVDPNKIDKSKVSSDLDALNEAEKKTTYKTNITKGIKNPKVQRAVSALKLSNPFKGY
ncbi:MAG: hypothetical protein WCY00_02895 [Candidatus Dojkabacteria bacterium]|jgi:hypothetical protein